jgi:hypothetical protein
MIDVTRYDVHAIPTAGRARGGLIIALQNRVFGAAQISVLLEEEYILALRVDLPSSSHSLILVNVYAPVHTTGYTPEIIRTIASQLELLSTEFPSASFFAAGIYRLRAQNSIVFDSAIVCT